MARQKGERGKGKGKEKRPQYLQQVTRSISGLHEGLLTVVQPDRSGHRTGLSPVLEGSSLVSLLRGAGFGQRYNIDFAAYAPCSIAAETLASWASGRHAMLLEPVLWESGQVTITMPDKFIQAFYYLVFSLVLLRACMTGPTTHAVRVKEYQHYGTCTHIIVFVC